MKLHFYLRERKDEILYPKNYMFRVWKMPPLVKVNASHHVGMSLNSDKKDTISKPILLSFPL